MDRQELRQRLAQRPNSVRPEELISLLEAYGWTLDRIRGSHHVFVRPGGPPLTVPSRRPHVLAVYVRRVLSMTEGEDEG
jgi:predicted RNA binding protein YcfA (HicA-like mRNA interferase family)